MSRYFPATAITFALGLASAPALAGVRADSHAPIGVMADHFHKTGEMMLSYRFMSMRMDGNLVGSDELSPDTIATTEPNRFAGREGQPPTLRVVPLNMDMQMHMFGLMYAPTDAVTLMLMASLVEKSMDHRTYQGGSGTTVLGEFTTESDGLGDTRIGALFALHDADHERVHATVGLSLPTGSTSERDQILAPNGMQPTPRLPYPMQLGSGSVDLIGGLSWAAHQGALGWGAQYDATLRLQDNDEGYRLGDRHELTGWLSRLWSDSVSTALRLAASTQGRIDGMDPNIVAPVQTADPDRQGGERLDLGLSINLAARDGPLGGQRLALEYLLPLHQDLNGPQLQTEGVLSVGWQYAF